MDLGLNKMWTSAVHTFRRTPDPFLWNCLIVLTGKSCKIPIGHDLLMLCFPHMNSEYYRIVNTITQ